jgi:hypothetical protein
MAGEAYALRLLDVNAPGCGIAWEIPSGLADNQAKVYHRLSEMIHVLNEKSPY